MSPSPVRILFVDDEERILRSLAMQFRRHYEVLTESDPRRALERLKTERIQVLVSDQRMPQMSGAELLAQAASAIRRPCGFSSPAIPTSMPPSTRSTTVASSAT